MKNSLELTKNIFLDYLVTNRGRSISTAKAYDNDLSQFIKSLIHSGIASHDQVTTSLIEDYLGTLKISAVTQARIRSSIKSWYRFLYNKDVIPTDPASKLESIKLPSKQPSYIDQVQYERLLSAVKRTSPYYRKRDMGLINLLFKSGLRRAEVVSLNIGDVDLASARLRVIRKGNKEQYLPIHPELIADLKYYVDSLERTSNQPLFISRLGNRLSAQALWHLVKGYAKQAGLDTQITTHSLRHGFASALLSQDVPLAYISTLMGHKNIQTTARYLHFQNSQLLEALGSVQF